MTILAFWSLVLQPGKEHRLTVGRDFQVTNAAFGEEISGSDRSVVKIHYFDDDLLDDEADSEEPSTQELVLCSLTPGKTEQASVNVTFTEAEEIGFSVTGSNPVHLIGNYIEQDYLRDDYGHFDSESGSDSSDSDESYPEDYDIREMAGLIDGESSEDEEGSGDKFEEIPEEHDEKAETKVEAPVTKDVSKGKKRSADAIDEDRPAAADTPETSQLSKSQKKKLKKNLKVDGGNAVETSSATPAKKQPGNHSEKSSEKQSEKRPEKQSEKQAGKQPEKRAEGAKKDTPKKEEAKSNKRTLEGGLVIEDTKIGSGPTATNGKRVGMRYIGKLENGKVFDSNTKGKPFSFILGHREVIQGWDIGIKGLTVGGERKLIIPPALGYGKQKLPGIPPNSTLIFEVKLVEVK